MWCSDDCAYLLKKYDKFGDCAYRAHFCLINYDTYSAVLIVLTFVIKYDKFYAARPVLLTMSAGEGGGLVAAQCYALFVFRCVL